MSSKKKIFALLLAAAIVALNLGIFCYRVPVAGEFQLIVELKVDHEEEIQIYYGEEHRVSGSEQRKDFCIRNPENIRNWNSIFRRQRR